MKEIKGGDQRRRSKEEIRGMRSLAHAVLVAVVLGDLGFGGEGAEDLEFVEAFGGEGRGGEVSGDAEEVGDHVLLVGQEELGEGAGIGLVVDQEVRHTHPPRLVCLGVGQCHLS